MDPGRVDNRGSLEVDGASTPKVSIKKRFAEGFKASLETMDNVGKSISKLFRSGMENLKQAKDEVDQLIEIHIKPMFPGKKEAVLDRSNLLDQAQQIPKSVTFSSTVTTKDELNSEAIKFVSSNVGEDAVIGELAKILDPKDSQGEEYVKNLLQRCEAKANKLIENLLLSAKTGDPKARDKIVAFFKQLNEGGEITPPWQKKIDAAMKKLYAESPDVAAFIDDVRKFSARAKENPGPFLDFLSREKGLIDQMVVTFLEKLENRQRLFDVQLNKSTEERNMLKDLAGINSMFYKMRDFSNVKREYEAKTKTGECTSSLQEYISSKRDAGIAERYKQINEQDVAFLPEFNSKRDGKKIDSKMQIFTDSETGKRPSLGINRDRFEVQTLNGPEKIDFTKIEKATEKISEKNIVDGKTKYFLKEIPLNYKAIKLDGLPIRVYDDGSFGSEEFMAAIVKDSKTGNSLLFCSVHLAGYDIADADDTDRVRESMQVMLPILEKFARANGVHGIMLGGDFNSVEENVTGAESPISVPKKREYVPLEVNQITNISLPDHFQRVERERKIDFVFFKTMEKGHLMEISKGVVHQPSTELEEVYDHRSVTGQVQLLTHSERLKRAQGNRDNLKHALQFETEKLRLNQDFLSLPDFVENSKSEEYRILAAKVEKGEKAVYAAKMAYLEAQSEVNRLLKKT